MVTDWAQENGDLHPALISLFRFFHLTQIAHIEEVLSIEEQDLSLP
jgi:hypothetical protein